MILQTEMTRSGYYTLKVVCNGKEYYLNSKYNPQKEAENWANSFYEEGNLFVMIGLGLGYHANALAAKMKKDDKLLILELSPDIYELAIKTATISQLLSDSRVTLCMGDNVYNLQAIVAEIVEQKSFTANKIFVCPNYDKIFAVNDILEKIKQAFMSYVVNINTLKFFAEGWQENYFKNIKYALKSVPFQSFNNAFSVPAVIVSAGPSLTAELKKLKMLANRALIISAGSATPVLQKNHIKPHIIVSFDGGIRNYEHFQEVKYDNVPLFYSPMLNYKILAEYRGPKVVFQSVYEISKWYNTVLGFETGMVPMGPSVANCALDIACKLTCGPICFVGQDLGYTGGVSHAEGNINRTNVSSINKALVNIEANDGCDLMSDYSFINMRDWFETYLSHCRREAYNAALHGAKIKGTTVIEFGQFINKFCCEETDISGKIEDILAEGAIKVASNQRVAEISKQIYSCLDEIESVSLKGKKLAGKLLNCVKKGDTRNINLILSKLTDVDTRISKLKEKEAILLFIVQPMLIKLKFWDIKGNKKTEDISIAEKNCYFYNELNKMSAKIKKMLIQDIK